MRPTDLPELRLALIDLYQAPAYADWCAVQRFEPAWEMAKEGKSFARINPSGDERRLAEIDRLRRASLFHVSAAMTELASTSARTLPDFTLEPFDLPTRHGLMIFEEPIAEDENFDGQLVFVSGISWGVIRAPGRNSQTGEMLGWKGLELLWLSWYIDTHKTLDESVRRGLASHAEAERQKGAGPRYAYSTANAFPFGLPPFEWEHENQLTTWGKICLSAWLLMQQRLAVVSDVKPDRSTRRRMERSGREPSPVRVVELRRPERTESNGQSDREYHHQWIVRGHWRQQWYASKGVHRPIWIAPHIKGPEGTPVLGGEKVYAFKR